MRQTLEEWQSLVRSQSHILKERPWLLFQQAANWREGSAPFRKARALIDAGVEKRPWLRRVNTLRHWPLCLLTLSGHTEKVSACDFSPDGELIASVSEDGTIGVWESFSGQRIRRIPGAGRWSEQVRFLRDSRHILGYTEEGRASVWNVLEGRIVSQAEDTSDVWLATSADGAWALLYSSRYNAWKFRDPLLELNRPAVRNAAEEEEAAHDTGFRTGAFSRDGRRVLTIQEGFGATVWDPVSRQPLCEITDISGERCSCCLSPEGSLALIAERKRLSIWDAEGGLLLGEETPEGNSFGHCEFSPDGTRILVDEYGGNPRLFDSRDFRQIAALGGHLESVEVLGFSPDSLMVATGADDDTLRLWCARTGEILATLWGHTAKVVAFAFSPDSRRLVSGSQDKTLRVWDVAEALESRYGHVYGIGASAICPDGSSIGAGQEDGTVTLTGINCDKEPRIMGRQTEAVTKCVFSPDGQRFAAGSRNGVITVWALKGGESVTVKEHVRAVSGLAFTPVGDTLISCSWDGTIRLWDPHTGAERMVLQGHEQDVNVMDVSRDGRRLVSGSDDGTLIVWDLAAGATLAVLRGHNDDIRDCAFSPDGARVLSSSRGLCSEGGFTTLKLWDAATGTELKNLGGHRNFGYRCTFSPDGRWMASGAGDGTCRLWDSGGTEVLVLPGGDLHGFSPNGRWLAAGADGRISLWSIPDGAEAAVYEASAGKVLVRWHPHGDRIVLADDAGCLHILRLENLEAG
jgi:WD40 repeat protein